MDFFIESQVKTFATFGDFPATGQVKTIYIDEATSNQYYWNGLSYVGLSDSNKVPYTGATGNVDLGENELKAGQITLDTSPTGTAAVGTTRWNNATGTSETTLKGGSVILKNGVDLVARVVNKVTPNTTLTKANYTAVRVSGAQGQRLAVAYAQANNDNNSADTIGLVIETIATNQEGFIMTVGQLDGINTTGSLQGETWVDGDVLYLSPTTPGALTNIKPTGLTGHIVVMGYVEYAHAVNGKIYVKIMNGWELDELHNVYIDSATLANNNILQYDSADQLWKNKVLSTGLTVGTTPISSGTIGRVLFQGTGNVLQQSSSLFWDSTNNRLGIGTSTPEYPLDILGNLSGFNIGFKLRNSASTGYTEIMCFNNGGTLADRMYMGVGGTTTGDAFQNRGYFVASNNLEGVNFTATKPTTGDIRFFTGGVNERLRIHGNGNIGINTTTDAGFRLDVNGTARVQGNTTVALNQNAITSLTIQNNTVGTASQASLTVSSNSNSAQFTKLSTGLTPYKTLAAGDLGIYNTTSDISLLTEGSGKIKFAAGGVSTAQMTLFSTGNFGINTTTDAGFRLDVNGTARVQDNLLLTNGIIATSTATTRLQGSLNYFTHNRIASSGALGFQIANFGSVTSFWRRDDGSGDVEFGNTQGFGVTFFANNLARTKMWSSGQWTMGSATAYNASALVAMESTTTGFLPPRMTTTQKNAIASPATGLQVFDTTLNMMSYYNGTIWVSL